MHAPVPPAAAPTGRRVRGFDFLRGLCALAVAFYHVFSWQGTAHFESWGRYGVYIFFVLSGASMYLAYERKFMLGYSPVKFIALRFARLAPLFVTVLLLKLAYVAVTGRSLPEALGMAVLNLSFLFGLGNPAATSQLIGGWSLGIEFLFYLMFPVLVAFVRGRAWTALLVLSFVAQHLYVSDVLAGRTLAEAWVPYTQMLSFLFYFVAGCCIGRVIQQWNRPGSALAWLAFAVLLAPLAACNGEQNLVGLMGLLLSLLAAAVVLAAAYLPLQGWGAWLADVLGKLSYGVYLLHPLVYLGSKAALPAHWPLLSAAGVVLASVVLALLAERYLEAPLISRAQRGLAGRADPARPAPAA